MTVIFCWLVFCGFLCVYGAGGEVYGKGKVFSVMYLLPFYYLFSGCFCSSSLLISSSFCFFHFGLMILFSSILGFLSFLFLCISCRFLIFYFWLCQVLVEARGIFISANGLFSSCGTRSSL